MRTHPSSVRGIEATRGRLFRRLWLGLVWLVAFVPPVPAQTTAEIIANTQWTVHPVGKGVVIRTCHFDGLFGGPQDVYVADADMGAAGVTLLFTGATGARKTVSNFAADVQNAAAAVNGNWFDPDTGLPIQFTRIGGEIRSYTAPGAQERGGIVIHYAGEVSCMARPHIGWEPITAPGVMASEVPLLVDGRPYVWTFPGAPDYDYYYTNRHPRSSIGVTAAGHVLLVVVDGRRVDSIGASYAHMAELLGALGAVNATVLDGGGSSTCWGRGYGVLNTPSDGRERAVADAVVISALPFDDDPDPETDEIAPGVFHTLHTLPGPVVVHVLEFDLSDPQYTIEMGFAQGVRNFSARERTSRIARRYDTPGHHVIAAINASHFESGIFIHGTQGNGSNLIGYPTLTWPRETYMLQESGEGFAVSDMPAAKSTVRFADGAVMQAGVFNYACGADTLAVYTPDWGPTTGSISEGVEVIVRSVSYPWRPNKWLRGRISDVRTGPGSVNNPIPADGFVLAACPGGEAQLISRVSVGDRIDLHVDLTPADLNNAKVICGGCSGQLVKDGAPFPESWDYSHAPVRHPRTALAWSGSKHWFVTFDGRQAGYSIGVTYAEMADFLVGVLGVENAVNLDGGGSTTMAVDGEAVNCPSDGASVPCTGTERAVPNALLLVRRNATTELPREDDFTAAGRSLAWDDKFSFNRTVSFSPAAPNGDGYVLEVVNPAGGYESASIGAAGDRDYIVSAHLYCDIRPEVAANGFERIGIFARDDGNANFDSGALGGGNCYALTFDSHDGRIRAAVVNDGVMTDFLKASPVFRPSDAWRRFAIECHGSRIRYLLDGEIIAQREDSSHERGRAGVGHHEYFLSDGNALGARVESFCLQPVAVGADRPNLKAY